MTDIFNLGEYGVAGADYVELKNSCTVCRVFEEKHDSFLLSLVSSYSGSSAPHINFSITVNGQNEPLYSSHYYKIGAHGEFLKHTFRIPFMFLDKMKLTVSFHIPDGTVLRIRDIGIDHGDDVTDYFPNIRHNAHLGLWGMAPDNTVPAFELAGYSGFKSCIAVPKVTKDGVLVCIHDDTVNRTVRDTFGNEFNEKICVCDKTYGELLMWECGSYKNPIYNGTEIPAVSQFFDVCERFGMAPMFSTHPSLDEDRWKQVRCEVEKRGLLKSFHIKGFSIETLESAYSVFSDEIDGYTLDSRSFSDELISEFCRSDIAKSKLRMGFEIPFGKYTEDIAKKILGCGFFAAAYSVKQRFSEEYDELISYGVTEFTEDLHCPVV